MCDHHDSLPNFSSKKAWQSEVYLHMKKLWYIMPLDDEESF